MKHWKHNIVGIFEETADRPRVYTTQNMRRLRSLVEKIRRRRGDEARNTELDDLIGNGSVVAPTRIPCDIVTLNSKISVSESPSSDSVTITVVFPKQEDVHRGKVSVLSPLGRAALGRRVGDAIEYRTPSKKRRVVMIERMLYQPEAMGHYRA